jgi:hypothetical protein
MSEQSSINLEFLKKQAKVLLKRCRAGDTEAIGRIRARLPRLAKLDDLRATMEIKLADVQYTLAREKGYANWGKLKRPDNQLKAVPDFSKPGGEGTLPDGFTPWRWGVSYTVQPEVLSRLACGKEYRIGVSILRNKPDNETFSGYADLYERANTIVKARIAELTCSDRCRFLHTRVLAHTWFRHASTNLVRAAVTVGVTCLNEGDVGPYGESKPTLKALGVAGGMTQEQLVAVSDSKKGFDELYSDGDVRDESDTSRIFLFSYGEYVKTAERIDYKPFVKRAENLTRFHLRFLKTESPSGADQLNIVRREWFCATSPDIAVIHIYVQR